MVIVRNVTVIYVRLQREKLLYQTSVHSIFGANQGSTITSRVRIFDFFE